MAASPLPPRQGTLSIDHLPSDDGTATVRGLQPEVGESLPTGQGSVGPHQSHLRAPRRCGTDSETEDDECLSEYW